MPKVCNLKTYLIELYGSLERASNELDIARSTLYNIVTKSPENILHYLPRLILTGKRELIGQDVDRSLLSAVVKDYYLLHQEELFELALDEYKRALLERIESAKDEA